MCRHLGTTYAIMAQFKFHSHSRFGPKSFHGHKPLSPMEIIAYGIADGFTTIHHDSKTFKMNPIVFLIHVHIHA